MFVLTLEREVCQPQADQEGRAFPIEQDVYALRTETAAAGAEGHVNGQLQQKHKEYSRWLDRRWAGKHNPEQGEVFSVVSGFFVL